MFRNSKPVGSRIAIAMAIGLFCSSGAPAKKPDKPPGDDSGAGYTILPFLTPDIPLNFESVGSSVGDLNDVGHAVGAEYFEEELPEGSFQTVRWALHLDMATWTYTRLQDCHTPAGVNNNNQIVGRRSSGVPAFWQSPGHTPVDLPLLSGDTQGQALAINDEGIIVGSSRDDEWSGTGVLWRVLFDDNGDVSFVDGPLPLTPLEGDAGAWGSDLNELIGGSFQVSGISRGEVGPPEAVVWTIGLNPDGTLAAPGPPVSLGTLGLSDPSNSYGNAINVLGDACGSSDGMPYVAPAGQTAQPLQVTRTTYRGQARDINDVGEIVGYLTILLKGGSHITDDAYLWKDGDVIDLETQIDRKSGWGTLWSANHINNAGVIAGQGNFDVQQRGFLLIPNGSGATP
jgi:hypothetical protein